MAESSYASNTAGIYKAPDFDSDLMDLERLQEGHKGMQQKRREGREEATKSSSSRLEIRSTDDSDVPEAVVSPLGGRAVLRGEKTVTLGLLERTAVIKRQKGEDIEKWIAKTTHLHVEGRNLTRLGGKIISRCIGLRYLYAYDNKMEILDPLPPKVEAIYLDDNKLEEIELSNLHLLRILSIKNNRLKNVESLAHCPLEELHLARQPISPSIYVMQGVACTLKILDMAECQIESLDFMIPLINLEYLDVSKNCIETVEDTISALENLSSLQKLYVAGNPFCRQLKYRDSIVVSCAGPLLEIDDKIISNAEKEFLKVVVPKRKLKKRSSLNIEVKAEMMDHDVDRELIN